MVASDDKQRLLLEYLLMLMATLTVRENIVSLNLSLTDIEEDRRAHKNKVPMIATILKDVKFVLLNTESQAGRKNVPFL